MPRTTSKHDYGPMHEHYVSSDISLRQLAIRYGISVATVSEYARVHDWNADRMRFRSQVQNQKTEVIATQQAYLEAELHRDRLNVLRATLVKYAQDLAKGVIIVTPKDAIAAVAAIGEMLAPAKESAASNDNTITVGPRPDAEFYRRLADLARNQLHDAGGVEGDPGPEPTVARPN